MTSLKQEGVLPAASALPWVSSLLVYLAYFKIASLYIPVRKFLRINLPPFPSLSYTHTHPCDTVAHTHAWHWFCFLGECWGLMQWIPEDFCSEYVHQWLGILRVKNSEGCVTQAKSNAQIVCARVDSTHSRGGQCWAMEPDGQNIFQSNTNISLHGWNHGIYGVCRILFSAFSPKKTPLNIFSLCYTGFKIFLAIIKYFIIFSVVGHISSSTL